MSINAKYGHKPDTVDDRDFIYEVGGRPLPEGVDLRSKMVPCWDQGQLGSCTGFGITAVVCYLHGFEGSQLWLYYNERLMEGTVDQDSGAQIRDGIKIIASKGLASLESWPYDTTKFEVAPSPEADATAKLNLVTKYQRLVSPEAYYECLASGFPFVIGISVFESFEGQEVARTGIVPMPSETENCLGGHCISVFGYTEAGDFICRNSWGTTWGQEGYFILPKTYLESNGLSSDAWMVTAEGVA